MKLEELKRSVLEVTHTPKAYTDYTPAESARLRASILAKGRKGLTQEEQAFMVADAKFWGPDDDPWKN